MPGCLDPLELTPPTPKQDRTSSLPILIRHSTFFSGSRAIFDHGNLLITDLWEKQTAYVVDTRVIDLDHPSYRISTPAQALASQEKVKKKKYSELCSEQRRHFSPYIVCVTGLLGREAKVPNKRLALLLARK